MRVSMNKNEENEKTAAQDTSTIYDHLMRVSMDKNLENLEKNTIEKPFTKYDHFIRVSMNKNEENKKLQLRIHTQ